MKRLISLLKTSLGLRLGVLLALVLALAASCAGGAVAALLVTELLDSEAPERTWSGTVTDLADNPVGGVLVQVKAEVAGSSDYLHFSDTTDYTGAFEIKYRWHKDINYTVRISGGDQVFLEQAIGKITLQDMAADYQIDTTATP